jgi:FKBP-type peptidyl-prolyl cis-trans isomerase
MQINLFKTVFASAILSLCLTFSPNLVFGQCGLPGTPACKSTIKKTPKKINLRVRQKTLPSKKNDPYNNAKTSLPTLPDEISSEEKTKNNLTNQKGVMTASGLTYIITGYGSGAKLKAGDIVTVHYTEMFTSGVKIDSSLDRSEPIAFKLGSGQVIKGLDEGITRLHVGDHAILIIPSEIAYGAKGRGSIPPDTTLIFLIEILSVDDAQGVKNTAEPIITSFPQQETQTAPSKQDDSPFTATYVGNNRAPTVEIFNDSDRTMYFDFGQERMIAYTIPSGGSQKINLTEAGNFKYKASAPRVRSDEGQGIFKTGHVYTWRFYINTVSR